MRSMIVTLSGLMMFCASVVSGQDYPHKPIRIVTSLPGGSGDFLGRLIAQGISGPMGQPVIVENRPSGPTQGDIVSRAPPDGYTLLSAGSSVAFAPLLGVASYDTIRDFAPVSRLGSAPNVLVVQPAVAAT